MKQIDFPCIIKSLNKNIKDVVYLSHSGYIRILLNIKEFFFKISDKIVKKIIQKFFTLNLHINLNIVLAVVTKKNLLLNMDLINFHMKRGITEILSNIYQKMKSLIIY